jgi:glucose/arabinose dehydrogenase
MPNKPVIDPDRFRLHRESVRPAGPGAGRIAVLALLLAAVAAGPAAAQTISFGKSVLSGAALLNPTSLQFGPDNRLYVSQQNGTLLIYTVTRSAPNSYVVSATETITTVRDMPNRNDDGTLNPTITGREVTGILVVGTAANPVIYVASSDPRIGAGGSGTDSNLDTNSGILSRLTWNGSAWVKFDLVRGLPRSEENHASNGLALDPATNTLFIAQGGNTNMGAPSNNFARLPEYALSAAILSVDLDAVGGTTYDLPTLDDPLASRNSGTPGVDLNDPFGGDNGANMAKLVPGGPVQVYAPGFRNPYDVVINHLGRMYTIDNGPNAGWGDVPNGEGTSTCTNAIHEPGLSQEDQLQYVTGAGFYGGHPNPTRANPANKFNGQSPVTVGDARQCDYLTPGVQDAALTTFGFSTNGLAEYTASNFGGAMSGDLLAASFDNAIYRVQLNGAGTAATLVQTLFSNVGGTPLDVWAQGNAGPFAGSIWVADYADSDIVVFEPADFVNCTGAHDYAIDEDGDHYSNGDELDNGTDPCSAADVPPDWDGDFISNLNDPDDDNDGLPDTSDPFAIDPANGQTTSLPVLLTWDNDAPRPGGLLSLGFTGLMTNHVDNYASLFDPALMTAGGAAGVCTVDQVPAGDAFASTNTQQYGFQFGVHVTSATGTFTAHTRILGPFAGLVPVDFQSMGLFVGTGDQDNYVKLMVSANGGAGGVQFAREFGGTFVSRPQASVPMPGPDSVDLFLTVDPAASTVQPAYLVTTGQVPGSVQFLGTPEPIPPAWVSGSAALAIGILSTSKGSGQPFPATWDFLKARAGTAIECTTDPDCDDANPCTDDVCFASACLHLNNTDPCNDGVACTSGDVCGGGVCQGTATCAAGLTCNVSSGTCEFIDADLDNDGLVGADDPCPVDPRNRCFGPVATDTATGKTIRLNAGVTNAECGGLKVDCAGQTWNADFGYNQSASSFDCDLNGGGEACVITGIPALFGCVDETTMDLFQCEHWDDQGGQELAYSFTVPNGQYLVNLFFANIYSGTTAPGERLFDINVEGQLVYGDFDQVAAAGGNAVAIVRSAVANVADGHLNILFGHEVENPAVKAIEVLHGDRDGDGYFAPQDCNDLDPNVHPGASDADCDGVDNNCNGQTDEGYVGSATACGAGACARTGVTSCVAGAVHDSCAPGAPQTEVCNGIDDNCNGQTDEGYASVPTTCGIGACARTGATSCVAGGVQNSCTPGAPQTEVCNGIDDDCDGTIDNAAPLNVTAALRVTTGSGGAVHLAWNAVAGASGYDLLRGDLSTLVTSQGDFGQAVNACLANDTTALTGNDADTPPLGDAFFYILRAVNCGGGTWDEGGAGQAAPRGPSIATSPAACP